MIDIPRFCQFCGNELLGRSDQKFCDGKCKSSFHNHVDRINRENAKATKNAIMLELDKMESNNEFDKLRINELNGLEGMLDSLRINELGRSIQSIHRNLNKL